MNTNPEQEFGKSPVKLSSPTQVWIDQTTQEIFLPPVAPK